MLTKYQVKHRLPKTNKFSKRHNFVVLDGKRYNLIGRRAMIDCVGESIYSQEQNRYLVEEKHLFEQINTLIALGKTIRV